MSMMGFGHRLLDRQRAAGLVSGDHFAKPGANDRIWGALDKLTVAHRDMPVETGWTM